MKKIIPLFLALILLLSSVSAFSTLSLDKIDFSEDGTDFNQEWLLLIAEDGRENFAVGSLSKTFDNEQLTDGTVRAENDLRITSKVTDAKCKYDIQRTSKILYRVDVSTDWFSILDISKWAICFSNSCRSNVLLNIKSRECPNGIDFFKLPYMNAWACITRSQAGIKGNIENKRFSFKDTITAEVNGDTATAVISNDPEVASSTDRAGDRIVAKFHLSGMAFEDCPVPANKGVSALHTNTWQIVDNFLLENALNNYDDLITCINDAKTNDPPFEFQDFLLPSRAKDAIKRECTNPHNLKVDNSLQEKGFSTAGSTSAIALGTESDGRIDIPQVKMLAVPVISLKVNADWLGIVQPETNPRIVDISSPECFGEGNKGNIKGNIYVKVKNYGNDGAVEFQINCESGFSLSGQIDRLKLDAGETATRRIDILASVGSGTTRGKCTVKVQDSNEPSIFDTADVSVCAEGINPCGQGVSFGTTRCARSDTVVEVCREDGWATLDECKIDKCEIINGVAQCTGEEPGCETDSFCINFYKDKLESKDGKCLTAYCDKKLLGKDLCRLDEKDTPECRKKCKPIGLGAFIIFPDLGESCMNSLSKIGQVFYLIKAVAYFLALILLPIFMNMILTGIGLKGKKVEGKFNWITLLRIVISIITGWLVAVLIWTLLYLAIGLYVGIIVIGFVIKTIIPISKGVSAMRKLK